MGLLGDVLGAVASKNEAPVDAGALGHAGLLADVLNMASNQQTGGLGGLIGMLQHGGLSSAVASWVGTGANEPVTPGQVQSAMGSDRIQQLAEKFGLPPSAVAAHLSQILPEVINHLTPSGTVPHPSAVESAIDVLKGKLFS